MLNKASPLRNVWYESSKYNTTLHQDVYEYCFVFNMVAGLEYTPLFIQY